MLCLFDMQDTVFATYQSCNGGHNRGDVLIRNALIHYRLGFGCY